MPLLDPEVVQKTLKQLGYWDGPADGKLSNPPFVEALRRFQRDQHLETDGVYGKNSDGKLFPLATLLTMAPHGFTQCRRWRMTSYYVAEETEYVGAATVPVYADDRRVLVKVTPRFFAAMSLEGTGKLKDGRLLNVTGKTAPADAAAYAPVYDYANKQGWIPKQPGYAGIQVADGKVTRANCFGFVALNRLGEGYGVQRRTNPAGETFTISLSPFKTVAADLGNMARHDPQFKGKGGVVPPGTRVWIPELMGRKLPSGAIHDGTCLVNDTGGGIFGAHFDLFVGSVGLKKQFGLIPEIAHIWFEGIEKKLPMTYTYGI
jgi:3D (Asp-Asp-Asp) domain-containing protein